jgi:hypothetical protein
MAAKLFDEILLRGIRSGQMPARTGAAREWYRDKAKEAGKITETSLMKSADATRFRGSNRFQIGSMYMFIYNPKHKDSLPYYDRFPLIFPVKGEKDGFYGINFHYLPLNLRAKLMDALYETVSNDKYDETTKLKISYSILSGVSKYKEFRPTFKRYLFSHISSRLLYVAPSEWDIALFLNVAQFEKASQSKVWKDSQKIIKGF